MEILVLDHSLTRGARIRLLRVARGWRQYELAFAAKVPPSQVSQAERDVPIYPAAMARICEVLGIDQEPTPSANRAAPIASFSPDEGETWA